MKAIVQDSYGTPDVLELRDVEQPEPGEREVLLRVRAAGVNIADWFISTGTPYVLRLAGFGLRTPKRTTPGTDVAGEVVAVGAGVTRFKPGDEVFGEGRATFAEYACADEDNLVAKPAGATFEEAAGLPLAGLTALQILRDGARLTEGQRLLVNGSSGGIGTYAVQIAKSMGAEVTAVCGPHNVDLVRELGADHVVDYSREDFTRTSERYDAILDHIMNHPFSALLGLLTPRGVFMPNSGNGGKWMGGGRHRIKAELVKPFTRRRIAPVLARTTRADLEELARMVESGHLRTVVGRTWPLSDAGRALQHVADGHARGKVVVTA
ncbi:NADPH:quinone reductase-like Zn-dependent oxidoreductase [Saccharothrix ecbatanensis]|uniref:NADPH:quinone reductase-like Zn-dependent oxidoreductase n=1 Tax=Saccharothrix ecbatanensis TaxID=1105145 RepID=A0A7W9HME4_9PSEU|nr:NAD(P)-dependent alcohol dehydrogenase [Saccharothrix ecbatanensis]MBB5804681.1 NADPH:quinone reductase-like Zn-dependent oxidoreductase [Saccharothrix ecbatanensis]